MKTNWIKWCALLFLIFSFSVTHAAPINDSNALQGVKTGKGVFLIDIGDPQKTAFYLKIIEGTHAGFVRQNVTTDFVLVFIGPTVRFLTTQPSDEVAIEYEDALKSIAESVKQLAQLGVRMEVCSVATAVFKIRNETLLPELKLVGDGFISLIGYQTQGYKLVPVF